MARVQIGDTVEAGNAVDSDIYTCPAGYAAIIGSIVATNSTGGGLNVFGEVTRKGVDYRVIPTNTIAANSVASYNRGSTFPVTPLVLNPGEIIKAQASGPGVFITISGLRFST